MLGGSSAVWNSVRYSSHCNLIGASKNGTALPTPIVTKLKNAKQHFLQSSYAELHPVRTRNWVNKDIDPITSFCDVSFSLDRFPWKPYPGNIFNMSCTKFYPKPTKDAENTGKILFTPFNKNALPKFSRNAQILIGNLLYRISPKSVNKCRKSLALSPTTQLAQTAVYYTEIHGTLKSSPMVDTASTHQAHLSTLWRTPNTCTYCT